MIHPIRIERSPGVYRGDEIVTDIRPVRLHVDTSTGCQRPLRGIPPLAGRLEKGQPGLAKSVSADELTERLNGVIQAGEGVSNLLEELEGVYLSKVPTEVVLTF